MSSIQSGQFLYPNVTSLPEQGRVGGSERSGKRDPTAIPGEFDRVFEQTLGRTEEASSRVARGLDQIREPLKFSSHATQRLRERKIDLDATTMVKVNDAIDKAEAKGIEDTLVLTSDAALIVSVKNRTVITAMDRGSLSGNVFTNIDGAVIV